MLKRFLKIFGPPPAIKTSQDFKVFLGSEAAYLAQRSTTEYCRARAGIHWQKLFGEPEFLSALERCRWEAFAVVLTDMVLVAEGRLRTAAGGDSLALADGLLRVYETILRDHRLPKHRPGWADAIGDLSVRLGRAQMAAPLAPDEIASVSGVKVYDLLPIHPTVRSHDRLVIFNHLRFGMLGFLQSFDRRVDTGAVAGALVAEGRNAAA